MATPGRVPAPELNLRPQLNPAPVVDVAMVRPVNREGAGSNLFRIADSLASFGNSLGRYGVSAMQKQEQPKNLRPDIYKAATAEQYASVPGFDPTDPIDRITLAEKMGVEAGTSIKSTWRTEFDPSKETWDDFVMRKVSDYQGQLPDDEMKAAFGRSVATFTKDAAGEYQTFINDTKKELRAENAWMSLYGVSQPTDAAKTPDARATAVLQRVGEIRKFNFLSPDETNKMVFNVLERYAADGDIEMVRAIGNAQRSDGIPPLSQTPLYRDTFLKTESAALLEWQKRNTDKINQFNDLKDQIVGTRPREDGSYSVGTPYQLTDLFNGPIGKIMYPNEVQRNEALQSSLAVLQKASKDAAKKTTMNAAEVAVGGKATSDFWSATGTQVYEDIPVTLNNEEVGTVKSNAVAAKAVNDQIEKRYEAVADNPQAIAVLDVNVGRAAAHSPHKIEAWEKLNSTIPTQINSLALEQGKVSPQMKRGFELWQNTRDQREVYLAKAGPNAEKLDDFYSVVQDRVSGGESVEVAMAQVARATMNAPKGEVQQRFIAVLRDNTSFDSRLNTLPPSVGKRAEDRIRMRIANGVNPRDAVEKELEAAEASIVTIGDNSIVSYPKAVITDQQKERFVTGMERILEYQKSIAAQQEPPLNPDDLSIRDNGDGTYTLLSDGVDAPAMFAHKRVTGNEMGTSRFTIKDIEDEMLMLEREEQNTIMKNEVNPMIPGGKSAIGATVDMIFGE